MRRGLLTDHFEGVGVKTLTAVETDPERSHQHEYAGGHLKQILGEEPRDKIPTTFIWLNDEQEGLSEPGALTWYDSRKNQAHRSPEWRLYYTGNSVTSMMKPGDSFFLALRPDKTAMVIVAPRDSTIQSQLVWLFDIDPPAEGFAAKEVKDDDAKLDFAARYILDELGIEPEEPEADKFDELISKFGTTFPSTKEFSQLARDSLRDVSALDDADETLLAWIEREEFLFRRLERVVVADRLKTGFMNGSEADVDSFIAFSLSVQNRRKSRAGASLEHHLEALFNAHDIRFQRGAETENKNKPDFLFPGQQEYRDTTFDDHKLTMLGSKSTCKDRWRQVLSEAAKIPNKHLVTLEPRITENQTDEMKSKNLQLVLPAALFTTYTEKQQQWLMNVDDFIELVKDRQNEK